MRSGFQQVTSADTFGRRAQNRSAVPPARTVATKEGAPDLFRDYFGQWMNAAPALWPTLVSAAGEVAKTHEIWIYPHLGKFSDEMPAASFAATTERPIVYARR
jgi:hypothetical protein